MPLVIRDILDMPLVDRDGEPLARVDAIVMEVRNGAPPRLLEFQLGFVPLARRFGKRAEAVVEAIHRRWSVRRSARYAIPCSAILDVQKRCIKVDVAAKDSVATDWERWIRRNVIERIPGSGKE